jgi:hypothetical protein
MLENCCPVEMGRFVLSSSRLHPERFQGGGIRIEDRSTPGPCAEVALLGGGIVVLMAHRFGGKTQDRHT